MRQISSMGEGGANVNVICAKKGLTNFVLCCVYFWLLFDTFNYYNTNEHNLHSELCFFLYLHDLFTDEMLSCCSNQIRLSP